MRIDRDADIDLNRANTRRAPTSPPSRRPSFAPGLLSTTTGWPQAVDMRCANARASGSCRPAAPIASRTGLLGQAGAWACDANGAERQARREHAAARCRFPCLPPPLNRTRCQSARIGVAAAKNNASWLNRDKLPELSGSAGFSLTAKAPRGQGRQERHSRHETMPARSGLCRGGRGYGEGGLSRPPCSEAFRFCFCFAVICRRTPPASSSAGRRSAPSCPRR
jgi:hypothetical protein